MKFDFSKKILLAVSCAAVVVAVVGVNYWLSGNLVNKMKDEILRSTKNEEKSLSEDILLKHYEDKLFEDILITEDYTLALLDTEKCFDIDPKNVECWVGRAITLEQLGKKEESLDAWWQVVMYATGTRKDQALSIIASDFVASSTKKEQENR
jgi:tetratricopeptide (TPR) repeat protein